MSGKLKTGDQLLEIVESDIQYIHNKFGITVIAWCTDDGPDGKKMRQLLGAKYWWLITLLCWAHQINLVVGDFLNLKADFRRIITLALDVVKWFNNHSQALDRLRIEQIITCNGKSWALILPIITRWTAHYLLLTQLLKVKAALTTCCLCHKPLLLGLGKNEMEAAEVLHTVADAGFWVDVRMYVCLTIFVCVLNFNYYTSITAGYRLSLNLWKSLRTSRKQCTLVLPQSWVAANGPSVTSASPTGISEINLPQRRCTRLALSKCTFVEPIPLLVSQAIDGSKNLEGIHHSRKTI
jgi:hypothetical protein